MTEPHEKYQSLSRCEAMSIHRQHEQELEQKINEAHDRGMKAGFDCGVETTINRIVPVETGMGSCNLTDCNNYNLSYVRNCSASITGECVDFKGDL